MAWFHCIVGQGGGGGDYSIPLLVTCDAQFAGSTITVTDGTTTLTEQCPTSSPYTVLFKLPNDGTWTISGVASGQTISTEITITEYTAVLGVIPDGSTVTPVNDIQIWLSCAGIFNKPYTTINQVLADTSTLLTLISSNNAVDYMVRSTNWANSVCGNSTAMTYINANTYCANTLLADSTWTTAICNSTYFETVLNVKVPTMTSETTPSGRATATSYFRQGYPWKAFNDSEYTGWVPDGGFGNYVRYTFTSSIKIRKCQVKFLDGSARAITHTVQIYGSNDGGTTLTPLTGEFVTGTINQWKDQNLTTVGNYTTYAMKDINSPSGHVYNAGDGFRVQFYGRA